MKAQVWILKRKGKKGISYAVQWIDPRTGRRRTESVGNDKAFAQRIASDRRRELLQGLSVGINHISYDDFVKEHLAAIKGQLADGTHREHDIVLRQFKEACGPKSLTVINFAMLEKFRQARKKTGNSPATINKSLRTLQSILERAVKRNYLKVNPFTGNRRALWLKEPEPTPRIVPFEAFQRLLGACTDDKWCAVLTIAYYGGLRRGEILALEWSDIDFDSGLIRVCNKADHKTKSRKFRQVPMSSQVIEALRRLEPGRFKNRRVFCCDRWQNAADNCSWNYEAIAKAAGLADDKGRPFYTLHDLRRTCATEMQRQGVPIKTVQKILGHSKMDTTARYYTGVDQDDMREAIKRLSERTA